MILKIESCVNDIVGKNSTEVIQKKLSDFSQSDDCFFEDPVIELKDLKEKYDYDAKDGNESEYEENEDFCIDFDISFAGSIFGRTVQKSTSEANDLAQDIWTKI